MQTIKVRPLQYFVPFGDLTRGEGDDLVRGYAFINEVVPGEGGIRLRRDAMERATDPYMQFGNIREMHGRNAAGVVHESAWDDAGWKIGVDVVDPVAKLKCQRGVYKGFSVGVRPTLMRGKDVVECEIFEVSLVDRPKDPDALFVGYRAEGIDFDTEVEVNVLDGDETTLRAETTDGVPGGEVDAPGTDAPGDVPTPAPETAAAGEEAEAAPVVEDTVAEEETSAPEAPVAEETPATSTEERVDAVSSTEADDSETISRILALEAESAALITRAEHAETELARVQGLLSERDDELARARERVAVLERAPAAAERAVRYPQAVDRDFLVNRGRELAQVKEEKVQELHRLCAEPNEGLSPDRAQAKMAKISLLKSQIAQMA